MIVNLIIFNIRIKFLGNLIDKKKYVLDKQYFGIVDQNSIMLFSSKIKELFIRIKNSTKT